MIGAMIMPGSETEAAKDADLLVRLQAGDRGAWEELIRRHADAAYALAWRILRNAEDAQDAVQQAFLRVRVAARTFRYGSDARSWINKIVCREALMLERSKSRRRQVGLEVVPAERLQGASRERDEGEVGQRLWSCMNELPDPVRLTLVLHFGGGLTQAAVAQELGCSRSTISERVQQGLALLRQRLAAAGVAPALALPQLLANSLAGAGEAAPPALLKRLVETPGISARLPHALRKNPAKSSYAAAGLAAVAAAGALAGLLYLLSPSPRRAPAEPAQPAEAPVMSPASAADPEAAEFRHVWNFAHQPPTDLALFSGAWAWARGEDGHAGYMRADGEVNVLIPHELPARPFVATVVYRITKRGFFNCDTGWVREGQRPPSRNFRTLAAEHPPGKWTNRFFFLDRYIVRLKDSREVKHGGLKTKYEDFPEPLRRLDRDAFAVDLWEFETPYPARNLYFNFVNVAVEEIEIRSLKAEEVPPALRGLEACVRELSTAPQQ